MSYNLSVGTTALYVSGEFEYKLVAGDALYYGDSPNVSVSNKIGALAVGGTLGRNNPSYIVSAGTSYVSQRARSTPSSASVVDPVDGGVSTYNLASRRFDIRASAATKNTEDWYGDWYTIGNAPGSIGFAGEPTAAPATTVGSGGVTLPLSDDTVPISDCAELDANGGSFTLGGHVVTYTGRSTSSGAGNATGCYTLPTATGTFASGTALSYETIGFGALAIYEKFGEDTPNAPIPGTTQAGFVLANYYGPTVNDSMEAFSTFVGVKDTDTAFAQNRPVTAFEAIAQIEGDNTMPTGASGALIAAGARTSVTGDSHVKRAEGIHLSHNTVGSDFGFTDVYYGVNQHTSALVTYTTLDGGITLPQATIAVADGSAMPPATPTYPVTVRMGANTQGHGGSYVTYTGVSANNLTGCTGGTATLSSGASVQNTPYAIRVKDPIYTESALQMEKSGYSGAIVAAIGGDTDSLKSQVRISGPSTENLTQLRLVAGTSQTTNIASVTNNAEVRRLALSGSGQLQMYGGDGSTQTVAIDPGGGITAGNTVSTTYTLGPAIYGGTGAPGSIVGRAEGALYLRSDGGAMTTIYQYRSSAWVGIV